MDKQLPPFLRTPEKRTHSDSRKKYVRLPFIDRTLKNIARFIVTGYNQGESALKKGWLQSVSAWAKVLFLAGFILVVSFSAEIKQQAFYGVYILLLFLISGIGLFTVYKKVCIISFFFGFLIIVPAALNIITPGDIVLPLLTTKTETQFWIYTFPKTIGFTNEGSMVVIRFWLKVFNSISLTFLIAYTTQFVDIVKSLKTFRVPDVLLLILTLTHKYLFILAQTTEEAYMALKARWWMKTKTLESTAIISGRISFIFRKSWIKYEEIYMAMIARGYTGKVEIVYTGHISIRDIVFLILAAFVAITGFYI